MPVILPTRDDLLRAMMNELIERAVHLYQNWSRPEYKYASLLCLAVGVSLYLSGFGMVPILWSMGISLIAGHFGVRATQALLSLYNQVHHIVEHVDVAVMNTNERILELEGAIVDVRARVTQAQPLIENATTVLADVRARVTQAQPLIENATTVLANAQTLPQHLERTLTELTTTVEHMNGAAQTTSTLTAPISYLASGFRAVGNMFSRNNATVLPENSAPEVTEAIKPGSR